MRHYLKQKIPTGFTLIELLVVIAIIGLLASTTLVALSSARLKSKIAKRGADLKQLNAALELYFNGANSYPSTSGAWRSQCASWGSYAANNVVPGLVPNFIAFMPADPAMNIPSSLNCYVYASDGVNYKLLSFINDMPASEVSKLPPLVDPRRNSLYNSPPCGMGLPDIAFSVYSPGARCW